MKNNVEHERKILVVDRDSQTIQFIRKIFTRDRDTTVLSARSADIAVEMAWKKKPDVIISDTVLLDLSGWEVLGILKKNDMTRSIPFIMIGDRASGIQDEVRALTLGADDYINKPFTPEVFFARVKAVLNRALAETSQKSDSEETLKCGDILINMSTHTVYVKDKKIDLAPKEFALLYLFMKKQNRVLNRVFLSGTIWEREYFDTSHTIDKHIANLRKKLGKEGRRIETLHTIGYKFVGDEEGINN